MRSYFVVVNVEVRAPQGRKARGVGGVVKAFLSKYLHLDSRWADNGSAGAAVPPAMATLSHDRRVDTLRDGGGGGGDGVVVIFVV